MPQLPSLAVTLIPLLLLMPPSSQGKGIPYTHSLLPVHVDLPGEVAQDSGWTPVQADQTLSTCQFSN